MDQLIVTDSNSWEREKFSYIFNNPSQEFIDFVVDASKYDSHMSVKLGTRYSTYNVKELNSKSRNSYMNRYGFYKEPKIESINPENGYDELFYKAVGISEI